MVHLFNERDKQINDAHELVNSKKRGYVVRKASSSIHLKVADVFIGLESCPENELVLLADSIKSNYRAIIPLREKFDNLSEWIYN